jgi:hypothetical protein
MGLHGVSLSSPVDMMLNSGWLASVGYGETGRVENLLFENLIKRDRVGD